MQSFKIGYLLLTLHVMQITTKSPRKCFYKVLKKTAVKRNFCSTHGGWVPNLAFLSEKSARLVLCQIPNVCLWHTVVRSRQYFHSALNFRINLAQTPSSYLIRLQSYEYLCLLYSYVFLCFLLPIYDSECISVSHLPTLASVTHIMSH